MIDLMKIEILTLHNKDMFPTKRIHSWSFSDPGLMNRIALDESSVRFHRFLL